MKRPTAPDGAREEPSDLNYLFFRQQVERAQAERATGGAARKAHEELARSYERQIEGLTSSDFHFPLNA